MRESDQEALCSLWGGYNIANAPEHERMMVLVIRSTPVSVFAILHAHTVCLSTGIFWIKPPCLGSVFVEKALRPTSSEDNEAGMGQCQGFLLW
jgi:hypothetical protein